MTVNTGVLGVSGYTGQALVSILLKHTSVSIRALFSTSFEGDIRQYCPQFYLEELVPIKRYDVAHCSDLDVIFLAVPHTKAMPIVAELREHYPNLKIIDLSADFRLEDVSVFESVYGVNHSASNLLRDAVYGLPEKYRHQIKGASLVANPGCYATAMILGMMPLKEALPEDMPVVIDAKSGVSAAGKTLKPSSLFCEAHDTVSAYATGTHRHMAELTQETGFCRALMSPHLVPIDRGIEAAIYVSNSTLTQLELTERYQSAYQDEPFVQVLPADTTPCLSLVQRTNQCVIIPKVVNGFMVVFSLIDNLLKGASGQAVQNMNIMFGLDESLGLN